MRLRCAVIGVGYLGKFHAQKYAALPNIELIGVADSNLETAQAIADELGCRAVTDYRDLVDDIDACSIVAPTTLHHQIGSDCLKRGIHVLMEKPITTTLEEADELIQIAKDHQCILQVGHLERFNAAVLSLGEHLQRELLFIESHRLAPFKPRATDVDVVLDLMIHDIDIILDFVKSDIIDLRASGASVLSESIDIANARLEFANGCVANVTASRVSQKSERKMRLFQHEAYIGIDFQEKTAEIHQKGEGEMYPGIPDIDSNILKGGESDALLDEIKDFIHAIQHNHTPKVTGEDGRRALATAMQITDILSQPHLLGK